MAIEKLALHVERGYLPGEQGYNYGTLKIVDSSGNKVSEFAVKPLKPKGADRSVNELYEIAYKAMKTLLFKHAKSVGELANYTINLSEDRKSGTIVDKKNKEVKAYKFDLQLKKKQQGSAVP